MSTDIVKVFISGNSQAVRLPHKYKVNSKEMFIRKEGEAIVLTPRPANWTGFMKDCEPLSDDFSIAGSPLPEDIERDKVP
jgi:antitoxin VapB